MKFDQLCLTEITNKLNYYVHTVYMTDALLNCVVTIHVTSLSVSYFIVNNAVLYVPLASNLHRVIALIELKTPIDFGVSRSKV